MRAGSTSGRPFMIEPGAHHVVELRAAGGAVVERLAELQAVADAAAIVHRQHDVALAGEPLIHRVGVPVVVVVVPAEQHLPARSAVEEDQRRPLLAGLQVLRHEQLRVDRHAVGGGDHHRLRLDELRGGEGRRQHVLEPASARRPSRCITTTCGGTCRVGVERGRAAVARRPTGCHSLPLDFSDLRRASPSHRPARTRRAGDRCRPGSSCRSLRVRSGVRLTYSTSNVARREQRRRAAARPAREYRCSQPSFSHGKTRRSPAPQIQLAVGDDALERAAVAGVGLPHLRAPRRSSRRRRAATTARRLSRRGENIARPRRRAPDGSTRCARRPATTPRLPSRSSDGSM